MTLDCVEIFLSRVFEYGQAYVALSRASSLQGLQVLDFDSKCVRAHTDVLCYYARLQWDTKVNTYNLYLCVKSKIAVIQPLTGDTKYYLKI